MAAKVSPETLALQALSRALADATPKVLHATKGKGIFEGSGQPAKQAAQHCLDQGWLEPTSQFEGKGKSRKELYRISASGIRQALEKSEPVTLLADALTSLEKNRDELQAIHTKVEESLKALQNQKTAMDAVRERLRPPNLDVLLQGVGSPNGASRATETGVDWLPRALEYLDHHRRANPYGHCPLPELFHRVAEPQAVSIGQFHDGLRELVRRKQVRLHPFTGAAYQLAEEQYALVAGQEIKYYVERVAAS